MRSSVPLATSQSVIVAEHEGVNKDVKARIFPSGEKAMGQGPGKNRTSSMELASQSSMPSEVATAKDRQSGEKTTCMREPPPRRRTAPSGNGIFQI